MASGLSALPGLGSLAGKLVIKAGKSTRAARYIENIAGLVGNAPTFLQAGSHALEGAAGMIDRYLIQGEEIGSEFGVELLTLGLNTFTAAASGRNVLSGGNALRKMLKEDRVAGKISGSIKRLVQGNSNETQPFLEMNLQFFGGKSGSGSIKRINVGDSGHHVPAVRKSKGRPFEVSRSDKTRPTIFSKGSDPGYDHWRLHDAERNYIGPRQGGFVGTDDELFDAYRNAYKGLDDIKVDVKSPNGTYILGTDVTPYEAVDLIQNWLKEQGLY